MRLTPEQASTIKQHAHQLFGAAAEVRLFGSRVRDDARGGDIDLLVSVTQPVERPALLMAKLVGGPQMALGDQRIDVLLEAPNLMQQPIHRIAREEGGAAMSPACAGPQQAARLNLRTPQPARQVHNTGHAPHPS